jgi:hypothetical protein
MFCFRKKRKIKFMKNGRGKETDLSKAVIGYSTKFLERSTGLTHLQRLAQWIDGFLFCVYEPQH